MLDASNEGCMSDDPDEEKRERPNGSGWLAILVGYFMDLLLSLMGGSQ
jgi:hypothetical protein